MPQTAGNPNNRPILTLEQQDIASIKHSMKLLQIENTRLTRESNDLKRLINDHAARINKNTTGLKNLDRSLRSEMQKIATGFKNVKAALAKMRGGHES